MKRFSMMATMFAVIFGAHSLVNAAALDYLPANGIRTELEDDDWELLVNAGGSVANPGADTIINEGDYFVGMLTITTIRQPVGAQPGVPGYTGDPASFSALFAIKVLTKNATGTAFTATFLSDAEWDAVITTPLGATYDKTTGVNTVAIVFDDPNDVQVDVPGDGSPIDDLLTLGGTKLWEFGFSTPAPTASNFWAVNALGGDDISTAGDSFFALFTAALDQTASHGVGDNYVFSFMPNSLLGPTFSGSSQLQLTGSARGPATTDFDLISDTDIFIQATVVPEPGSIVLLGMGAAGMFGARARRRRATRAQQQAV